MMMRDRLLIVGRVVGCLNVDLAALQVGTQRAVAPALVDWLRVLVVGNWGEPQD